MTLWVLLLFVHTAHATQRAEPCGPEDFAFEAATDQARGRVPAGPRIPPNAEFLVLDDLEPQLTRSEDGAPLPVDAERLFGAPGAWHLVPLDTLAEDTTVTLYAPGLMVPSTPYEVDGSWHTMALPRPPHVGVSLARCTDDGLTLLAEQVGLDTVLMEVESWSRVSASNTSEDRHSRFFLVEDPSEARVRLVDSSDLFRVRGWNGDGIAGEWSVDVIARRDCGCDGSGQGWGAAAILAAVAVMRRRRAPVARACDAGACVPGHR